MTTCPSREQFQRLLNNLLDEAEEQVLEVHLDSCPNCLATLDELTAVSGQTLRIDPSGPLAAPRQAGWPTEASDGGPDDAELVRRLRLRLLTDIRSLPDDEDALPEVEGYKVLSIGGRGGMSVVYKAEQLSLKRIVALKMLRAAKVADAGSRARFRTEVLAVARLQHPNIVHIFEVGEVNNVPYFSMEYVEAGSLADHLAGRPQLPGRAAELVEIVARAIHFAHEHGIVHRDLKPANILLQIDETSQNSRSAIPNLQTAIPKITDFGLAKFLEVEPGGLATTAAGLIQGTPCYMAPEQARPTAPGMHIGPAADVYSLGTILYEMLTGRPPFVALTPLDTVLRVLHNEPIPPRRYYPEVPRDLETICLKCLAKDPAKRFASAAELAEDLRRFLAGETIKARPVSRAERLERWCRRNPVVASLLAALAVVLIAGFTLVTWKWRDEVAATDGAREEKQRADLARREAERLTARVVVDLAIIQGDNHNTDRALLLLAKGLELADKSGDQDLERVIRLSLTAWRSQLLRRRATLPHDNWAWGVTYSPDGSLCATASRDKTARLWSTTTGQPVGEVLRHEYPVWTAAFSPDGKRLATGSGDERTGKGEIRLWEVPTGKSLGTPRSAAGPDGKPGEPLEERFVSKVTFSNDGQSLLVLSMGQAQLWKRIESQDAGESYSRLSLSHPEGVFTAVLSPDGSSLLTAGADGTARLWDSATGKLLGPPLRHEPPDGLPPGQRSRVAAAAFSPDGKLVLTGSQVIDVERKRFVGGEVCLWQASTGALVGEPWPHRGPLKTVVFSPDSQRALTAGIVVDNAAPKEQPAPEPALSGEARLWHVATGQPIGPRMVESKPIWAAAFSPDGRTLLTGSEGGNVQFWLAATCLPLGLPKNNIGNVNAVCFSPDGNTALTSRTYEPAEASLWETPPLPGDVVPEIRAPDIKAFVLSADGRGLATVGSDGSAQLWDMADKKPLGRPLRFEEAIHAVAFSPDGKTLALADEQKTVRLCEVPTGKPFAVPLVHQQSVRVMAFSPDGKLLLTGGSADKTFLWNVASGATVREPVAHSSAVEAVAFNPNGQTFVVGCFDGTVQCYHTASGQPRGPLMRHPRVFRVAFSPDGKTIATGGFDHTAWLWDAATGQPLCAPLQHQGHISSVAFSPDGKLLLTGSQDRGVRLWDVATGLRIGPLLLHDSPVQAAFDPAKANVVTIAEDGFLRHWEAPSVATQPAQTVRQWVEALTGKELTDRGVLRELEANALRQRRQDDHEKSHR